MALPQYETLTLSLVDHIATVELARPDKANAMNTPMWRELQECFEWLDTEASVRVVILAGQGKHFCAGLDLASFGDDVFAGSDSEPGRTAERLRRRILELQDNLTSIERCRVPVLAAIHGACVGGGIDMTTCCDMRYCSEDAFFSIKEIDIGMTADVGTLQRLPHLIGQGVVRELAYTGRRLDAAEAYELQLVNRVYADRESMMEDVSNIAREIATKSPLAIRGTKEMLLYSRDHSVTDGLNYIATWNAGMLSQHDLMTSMSAGDKTAEFDD
jgi:enoyl-CoA hydratase